MQFCTGSPFGTGSNSINNPGGGSFGGNNDFDDPDINCDPLGTCYDGKKLFKQQQMCCAIMNFS